MDIGSFIRMHRKRLDLTQEDIARALGYDNYQMISNIERGIASLPKFKVPKLAEILQVAEADILDTSFKGRKLGENRDIRVLFERGMNQRKSAMSVVIDKEDEPELYRIITRVRNSKLREKFISIANTLLDLEPEERQN